MTDPFDDNLAAWRDYTATPWARIRYAVVGELLLRQCRALGEHVRVLDVGGGDGMDALPLARHGHDVTIADPAPRWLAEAERRAHEAGARITTVRAGLDDLPSGEWDLVLCHFVLRYRDSDDSDGAALAARVRPGGRLSIMDVNPAGRVLRELVTGGPRAAAAELRADRADVGTFKTVARKVHVDAIRRRAEAAGLTPVAHYGNRIANDLLVDEAEKYDVEYFADLVSLELALCDQEPFNRIGFAWQLVLERHTPQPSVR